MYQIVKRLTFVDYAWHHKFMIDRSDPFIEAPFVVIYDI